MGKVSQTEVIQDNPIFGSLAFPLKIRSAAAIRISLGVSISLMVQSAFRGQVGSRGSPQLYPFKDGQSA